MLRLAASSDAPAIAAIFAPYVLNTAISFAETPPSAADFEARIGDTLRDFPFLVLEEEGAVRGYAYASRHRALAAYRWDCEVSIYMDGARCRRGGASRLYGALLALLRKQGLQQAYAGITLPNEASVRLHEKFGFRFLARYDAVGYKAGAWRDVGWWALRLQAELPLPPPDPLSFAALREKQSAEVSRILAGN